jgi:ribosomal protein S4
MESERKIVLLSDFIEQKVRKEKELEYYTQQLEELQKKLFFLNKEIELTNLIIDIIDKEQVINVKNYLEDKSDNNT